MEKLLPVLFSFFFLACRQAYMPETKDVKEFFAQMDDGVLTKKRILLVDSFEQFPLKSGFFKKMVKLKGNLLTDSEIEFIVCENNNTKKGVWTIAIFENAKIVPNAYIDSVARPDPMRHTPAHYKFSLPWFSKDKKYSLFYYDFYCGSLCAESSLRLYKKVNGKWVYQKTYFRVVS